MNKEMNAITDQPNKIANKVINTMHIKFQFIVKVNIINIQSHTYIIPYLTFNATSYYHVYMV